jgi:hypothetical protein
MSARLYNSLNKNHGRICGYCGKTARFVSFRAYKFGVRYAKRYHCTAHVPRDAVANYVETPVVVGSAKGAVESVVAGAVRHADSRKRNKHSLNS